MTKQEVILRTINTLNLIEVKGFQNLQLLYGLMSGLQEELEGDKDGTTKQ